ncbi:hypothetical protein CCR75_005453 [Bremia lactucae]|uniref:Uncharacterized protein n=1 Tax=Bremia lactucae TaxID=4779 RepID=A0A976FMT6_BRELC|nr:hypothetical protein CCR75_009594 [Bremia lactucae]TDH69774.1 hypothetical protein CCR75_005453 [Bremia lactucae]
MAAMISWLRTDRSEIDHMKRLYARAWDFPLGTKLPAALLLGASSRQEGWRCCSREPILGIWIGISTTAV